MVSEAISINLLFHRVESECYTFLENVVDDITEKSGKRNNISTLNKTKQKKLIAFQCKQNEMTHTHTLKISFDKISLQSSGS